MRTENSIKNITISILTQIIIVLLGFISRKIFLNSFGAEYLGVNKDSIRNWIKKEDSEIPAHKIGKQWKFKKSELDEWVKSGKSAMN